MRAVITGCGSGFGRALCERLLDDGHEVVGTDVTTHGLVERILEGRPEAAPRLTVLALSLSDDAACAALADHVGEVDLLVNNAGYAMFATQAEGEVQAVARLFDVNVLGAVRVTRALLPSLRSRRGTVVQLSSVAGRMVFPESGFYAATKHALEALSEALYLENVHHGLRVVVVEPGAFDTGFAARARQESPPRRPDSAYADQYVRWDARKDAVLESPQDPIRVAAAIVEAVADPRAFLRVRVGGDCVRILGLRDVLSPPGPAEGDRALLSDPWVDLQAERVGGPRTGRPLAGPDEVLTTPVDALSATWPATVQAARAGELDHWSETVAGAEALARLLGRGGAG